MLASLITAALALTPPEPAATSPALEAPLAKNAPVLDGRLGADEWTGAATIDMADGLTLLSLRHGNILYLALRSAGGGIGTIALDLDDEIHILHASHQLGRAIYKKAPAGDAWKLSEDFAWTPVDAASPPTEGGQPGAIQSYFQTHGWAGTTIPFASAGAMEIMIALDYVDRLAQPDPANPDSSTPPAAAHASVRSLALGHFSLNTATRSLWPKNVGGVLAEDPLHLGSPPARAAFDPALWLLWPTADAPAPESGPDSGPDR